MVKTHGLVFGKFYPPHRGHKFLIDTASEIVDNLTVLVLANPVETIPVSDRVRWMKEIHPTAHVYGCTVDIPTNYDPKADDVWDAWTEILMNPVWYKEPYTYVISSEDYGDEQARRIWVEQDIPCKHIKLDMDRNSFPVSATMVRANPAKQWWNLEPVVRADMTKKIVLVGAESVGKSTLARNLGIHYNTPVMPEYGRLYSLVKEVMGTGDDWTAEDFDIIAKRHIEEEEQLARQSGPVLICDTDMLATAIWHERYMNREPHKPLLLNGILRAKTHYDHYILPDDEGTPYVDDGMRIDDGSRPWMTQRFKELFDFNGIPYTVVSGTWEDRYDQAVHAIDGVLWRGWNLADPIA